MLRFVLAAVLAAAVAGCSDAPALPSMDGGVEDAAPTSRSLALEGARERTLMVGESTELTVRYLEASGQPIVGAPVRFGLEGRAHDSTLAALEARTDASGRASVTLAAGTEVATFRVRASADDADPVSFDVAVSDLGFGELEVTPRYEGQRSGTIVAAVFADASCDDARVMDERGDRVRLRGPDDEHVRFVGLPVGLRYAVVGRVEGTSGSVVARGCVDGVELEAERRISVEVTVEDLPYATDGTFDVVVALEAPETNDRLGRDLVGLTAAYFDEDGADATRMLDAIEARWRAAGEVAALGLLTEARATDALDARWSAALADAGVGPEVGAEALTELLGSRLGAFSLRGVWRVSREGAIVYRATSIRAGAGDEVTDVTLSERSALEGRGTLHPGDDDEAWVEDLRIALPLDRLANQVLSAEASAAGHTRRDAYVSALAGCAAIPPLPDLDLCDAECRAAACHEVTRAYFAAVDLHLLAIGPARQVLAVAGLVELLEDDGDREADRIRATLEGTWGSELAASPEAVELTLEGDRVDLL
ncbi:MAG: Ig-like domain-containing protein [Myxococcales bacterium]|nr:Ig-like domain-containing protein [Myxococcales bacterium]